MPDFSWAGYHNGQDQLPEVKPTANVKTLGAKGDGKTDDTAAFKKAIEQCKNGAILIPPGKYVITDFIEVRKSNLVLKGSGVDKTILFFPKPLEDIKPTVAHTTGGKKTSAYSWSGGFIYFRGSTRAKPLLKITAEAKRGDTSLSAMPPKKGELQEGQLVEILVNNDADNSLVSYMYAGDAGGAGNLKKTITLSQLVKIKKITSGKIELDRPLRFDIRMSWSPEVLSCNPTLQESGLEDLTIEFPVTDYMGHFKERGYNGIALHGGVNCWVKNIKIKNADSGLFSNAKSSTFSGITLVSERGAKSITTGHHGILITGQDNLVTNFNFETSFIHDFTVTAGSFFNVFSNGKGVDISLDHHSRAPYENLFTNMDVGSGKRIWHSGGGAGLGKHAGARNTYWNIRATTSIKFPGKDFGPDMLNLVAVNPTGPSIKEKDGKWYEAIATQSIFPPNIHEAQLEFRLSRKGGVAAKSTGKKKIETTDKSKLLKYRLLD